MKTRDATTNGAVVLRADGRRDLVHERTHFKLFEFLDNTPAEWQPVSRALWLGGLRVNPVDEKTMQVVSTGEVLTIVKWGTRNDQA